MNKMFKKLLVVFTAFLMMFALVPVHAETIDGDFNGYWFWSGDGSMFIPGNGGAEMNATFMVGGTPAYCIQPEVKAVIGQDVYTTSTLSEYNALSPETKARLSEISYFGYLYGDRTGTDWYAATQEAIWGAIDSRYLGIDVYYAPDDGNYLVRTDDKKQTGLINSHVADIMADVNAYEASLGTPNFVIKDDKGNTVGTSGQNAEYDSGIIGKTYTVTDTNGIISNRTASTNQFSSSSISGNDISITLTKDDLNQNHIIHFSQKVKYNRIGYRPMICVADDAQHVMTAGDLTDPQGGTVTLNAIGFNLSMTKTDADGVGRTQGDATSFAGTSYVIRNKVSGETVGTLTIGTDGTSNTIEGLAPDTYTYQESHVADGYNVDPAVHEITITDSDAVITAYDSVKTGTLSIHKVIANSKQSDFTEPEPNAVFEAILTKYVTQYGSFEEAMKHTADYSAKEWSVFTTDKDGNATSGALAYGDYTVKQTGCMDGLELLKQPFNFTVSEQNSTQTFDISNIVSEFYLRIEKKDLDTNKNVTADGADFKIYQISDATGKAVNAYVEQQVGSTKYSTFRTVSNNGTDGLPDGTFYSKDEVSGTVVAPLKLEAGVYRIEETKAPYGYTLPENTLTVTLSNDTITENINGNDYVEADVQNQMITGTLNVTKQLEAVTADEDLTTKDFTKVKFAIVAKEDINSVLDGTSIVKAGETYKEFNLDAEGKASITEIPLGKYTLVEEAGADGMVKASPVDFAVAVKDDTTPVITIAEPITNKVTPTEISKTDATGEKELAGAVLELSDDKGTVVSTWTSVADKSHTIAGLTAGKTYTLKETSTPDGYYYSTAVTFKVNEDGTVNKVNMIDNQIHYQIAKVDDKGNYVKGVTLKLTDTTTNTPVTLPNNGITTDKPFDLAGVLNAEHSYLLEESEYVAGVYKATSVNFTVPKTGTADITTIKMVDLATAVTIQKLDNHGNPVSDATLQVLEATKDASGNITAATDKDGKNIVVKEYKTTSDAKGIDISDDVKGGASYILHEVHTPFGFETSKDIPFTVTGTNTSAQVIEMTDCRKTFYVSAVKVDAQDQTKLLPGAEITLFLKDGTVAKDINGKECKGTTDGQGVITWNVEFNGDLGGYYVQETGAPVGYRINDTKYEVTLAEDYNFAQDNAYKIVVNDEAVPAASVNTGDATNALLYGMFFISSMAVAAWAIMMKKKHSLN